MSLLHRKRRNNQDITEYLWCRDNVHIPPRDQQRGKNVKVLVRGRDVEGAVMSMQLMLQGATTTAGGGGRGFGAAAVAAAAPMDTSADFALAQAQIGETDLDGVDEVMMVEGYRVKVPHVLKRCVSIGHYEEVGVTSVADIRLNRESLKQITALFNIMDRDNSGYLDQKDFEIFPDQEKWRTLRLRFDESGDGRVDVVEFREGFKQHALRRPSNVYNLPPLETPLRTWLAELEKKVNEQVQELCLEAFKWYPDPSPAESPVKTTPPVPLPVTSPHRAATHTAVPAPGPMSTTPTTLNDGEL